MARFFNGMVVGVVATFTLTGTAYAATGGNFILGRSNAASTQTALSNSGSGPVLALNSRSGQAPLAVGAGAGKATNLNADKLDGLDSAQLQRRVTGTCPEGESIRAINGNGAVTCDDQQTYVSWAFGQTGSDGDGIAYCPAGYVAIGGSYYAADFSPAYATFASVGKESDGAGRYYYIANLAEPASGNAVSGAVVSVQCVYGNLQLANTPPALRRDPAALRRK